MMQYRSNVVNWLGNIRFIQAYRFSHHIASMDEYCLVRLARDGRSSPAH